MNVARPSAAALAFLGLPLSLAHAESLALRYDVYAGGTLAVEMEAEIELTSSNFRLGAALELAGVYALVSDWGMATTAIGLISNGEIVPISFSKFSEGGERWAEIRCTNSSAGPSRAPTWTPPRSSCT